MTGHYRDAVVAELVKARRSRLPLGTFLAWTAAGVVAGLFMYVTADPDRARRLGLVGQKARLAGLTADWPSLLAFLAQIVAVGDLGLFSFVIAWVFGREATDGTLRYLLALPVARGTIAAAKFTVVALWAIAGSVWLAAVVVVLGFALGLPGFSVGLLVHGLGRAGLAAVLLLLVCAPVAYVACVGRGYLAPLAAALAALVLAQVAGALGWGGIFPWSVPAVAAGLVPDQSLTGSAVLIVLGTAAVGVWATVQWWRSGRAGA